MMSFVVLAGIGLHAIFAFRDGGRSCPSWLTLVLTRILTTWINPKSKGGGQECPPHTKFAAMATLAVVDVEA